MLAFVVLGFYLLVNVNFCIATEETAPMKTGLLHSVANPSKCLYNMGYLINGGYMSVGDCRTDWRGLIDISKINELESGYGNLKFANGFCITNYGQPSYYDAPLRSWNCSEATSAGNRLQIVNGTADDIFRLALESFGGSKCVYWDPRNDYGVQFNCLQPSSSLYNNQAWVIEPTDNTWKVLTSFGSPGMCVNYDSKNALSLLKCSREYRNEIVALTKKGNYSIKFVLSSHCIKISNSSQLKSYACGNGSGKDFTMIEIEDAGIRLKARNRDFCLTTTAGAVNFSPCNEDLYDFSQNFYFQEFSDLPRRYNLKGVISKDERPLQPLCLKSLLPGKLSQLIIQDCTSATATFTKIDNNVNETTSGSVRLNGNCLTLGDGNVVWENICGVSAGQDWFLVNKTNSLEPIAQIMEASTGKCLTGRRREVAYVKDCGETEEAEEYQSWYISEVKVVA